MDRATVSTPPEEALPALLEAGVPIASVERDTGLSKDTLRVWERRYGFPTPARDDRGDRLYSLEQVQRLRMIKRLLDQGWRAGRVVGLSAAELEELQRWRERRQAEEGEPPAASARSQADAAELAPWLALIALREPQALSTALRQAVLARGLSRFVCEVVAPLTQEVGAAWSRGDLGVFEEHLYTEAVNSVLHHAMATSDPGERATPRLLLSTLPGEEHGLGLLMVQALATTQGAMCLPLGPQTPLAELVQAAQALRADIVGLSFTPCLNARVALAGLIELRERLPASVELWAGGSAPWLARTLPQGVRAVLQLREVPLQLQRWQAEHRAA